ncbi:MAG: XdhC family protein [Firmicutes bacterium]|nr:XdhC family protein [Bacillota bacterium]
MSALEILEGLLALDQPTTLVMETEGPGSSLRGWTLDEAREGLRESLVPGHFPPWLHFCAQQLRKGRACVLATVVETQGSTGLSLGDRFAYDEKNHGLLPMDPAFSLDLGRFCDRVRDTGSLQQHRFTFPQGTATLVIEGLRPTPE